MHPTDRTRIETLVKEALDGSADAWSGEYQIERGDKHYIRVLERAVIVRDENGKAVRFVGAFIDVTARRQLQDQLSRSQKMEAFGQVVLDQATAAARLASTSSLATTS